MDAEPAEEDGEKPGNDVILLRGRGIPIPVGRIGRGTGRLVSRGLLPASAGGARRLRRARLLSRGLIRRLRLPLRVRVRRPLERRALGGSAARSERAVRREGLRGLRHAL